MFLTGLTGFVHETFFGMGERPFLIAASLALMGLPFVLQGDKIIVSRRKEEPDA